MLIDGDGIRYPESQGVILASRVGESTHAPGTWSAPCAWCKATCLVDLRSHLLIERTGIRVACLRCAATRFPDLIAGQVEGRPVTIREAIEHGWLIIPGVSP
jgi:hypothetical protein